MNMDGITERDVVKLSNTVATKCDLGLLIYDASQCDSDFLVALYLSIMGELPSGILTDCQSVESQHHNVMCIIDTLANDHLHVDLSHISPSSFVGGDLIVKFNLLEILDGLLEFMLEHISSKSDSGDEGDVDSDQVSVRNHFNLLKDDHHECGSQHDSSTCTADLIDLDLSPYDISSEGLANKYSAKEDGKTFVPLPISRSPVSRSPVSRSPVSTENDWVELQPQEDLSEHSITVTDESQISSKINSTNEIDETAARPMLIDSLKYSEHTDSGHMLEDITRSLNKTLDLRSTYKVSDVYLDSTSKGTGMSVSDVTSQSSKADSTSPVVLEDGKISLNLEDRVSASEEAVDVADGIPRPTLHGFKDDTRSLSGSEVSSVHEDQNWEALLDNLHKTVEESRRIREKYFTTPNRESVVSSEDLTEDRTDDTHHDEDDEYETKPQQRNVRFEDTVSSKTAKEMKEFKDILKKEKQLQDIKNRILSNSFNDHLEEVKEVERRKLTPLVKRAENTQQCFQASIANKNRGTKKPSIKKDLAMAAKWKSWQSPVVVRTPQCKFGRVKTKIRDNVVIGEHDLLPTLIENFPGLELSSVTLNNAWKKQFRQIEALTKSETNHMKKKQNSEKQLQEAHHRHQLLTDIMRREHEYNQRIRETKERAASHQEAAHTIKDRRQQSARVRRYYRDYQLQMRARMLKRRTKEERLFKNLFEEGLNIQRSRLNDLRKYARDKRDEQQQRQRNEIASLENYYKDQFEILAETLEREKKDLKTRDEAQTKLLRQMKSGLRIKMEGEIHNLQERIARDDEDIYYRELEADRVRRQLQLATYNAKFNIK